MQALILIFLNKVLIVYCFFKTLCLELFLNAMQEEYADWQNVVGMKVMIHEQNASSFVDSTGYNLSPGLDTSLSFIKVAVQICNPL